MVSEEQLQAELKSAMKAREMRRVYVLRGLLAAIKNVRVEKQTSALEEADLVALVRKELNKRLEAMAYGEKAGRADTVADNQAEKAILEAYLPAQLDAERLEAVIRALAVELGTTQIGPLMAELKKRHSGEYDGKLASEIIRRL